MFVSLTDLDKKLPRINLADSLAVSLMQKRTFINVKLSKRYTIKPLRLRAPAGTRIFF